jgi:hypothetical protein
VTNDQYPNDQWRWARGTRRHGARKTGGSDLLIPVIIRDVIRE